MAEINTVEELEDEVNEKWDETRMSDRWMSFLCYLDDSDRLVSHLTQCNFRKADAYIAISSLAMFIGQENGYSEEYLSEFREKLVKTLWQYIGRPPAPEPLPLAKHLRKNNGESNGTTH